MRTYLCTTKKIKDSKSATHLGIVWNVNGKPDISNRNAHVLIGGDFDCGDIEWRTMQVPHGVQKRQTQQQLLDIIGEHCLTQVVNIPTRLDKTLDLLFTNVPSPVNRVKGMPPIGKADHDLVFIEYDIKD